MTTAMSTDDLAGSRASEEDPVERELREIAQWEAERSPAAKQARRLELEAIISKRDAVRAVEHDEAQAALSAATSR